MLSKSKQTEWRKTLHPIITLKHLIEKVNKQHETNNKKEPTFCFVLMLSRENRTDIVTRFIRVILTLLIQY